MRGKELTLKPSAYGLPAAGTVVPVGPLAPDVVVVGLEAVDDGAVGVLLDGAAAPGMHCE